MALTPHKDLQQLIRKAEKDGFVVTKRSRSSHLKWVSPKGNVSFTGSTPSDPRAIKNIRSWVKGEMQ